MFIHSYSFYHVYLLLSFQASHMSITTRYHHCFHQVHQMAATHWTDQAACPTAGSCDPVQSIGHCRRSSLNHLHHYVQFWNRLRGDRSFGSPCVYARHVVWSRGALFQRLLLSCLRSRGYVGQVGVWCQLEQPGAWASWESSSIEVKSGSCRTCSSTFQGIHPFHRRIPSLTRPICPDHYMPSHRSLSSNCHVSCSEAIPSSCRSLWWPLLLPWTHLLKASLSSCSGACNSVLAAQEVVLSTCHQYRHRAFQ